MEPLNPPPISKESIKSLSELIFGNDIDNSSITEEGLSKAIEVKIETEKTKQQYYRLENVKNSIELLKLAINAGIPSNDISKLFMQDNDITIDELGYQLNKEKGLAKPINIRGRKPLKSENTPLLAPIRNENDSLDEVLSPKSNHVTLRQINLPTNKNNNFEELIHQTMKHSLSNTDPPLKSHSRQTSPGIRKSKTFNSQTHFRNKSLPTIRINQNSDIPINMTSVINFAKPKEFGDHLTCTFALEKPVQANKDYDKLESSFSYNVIDMTVNDNNDNVSKERQTTINMTPKMSSYKNEEKNTEINSNVVTPESNITSTGKHPHSSSLWKLLNAG
ncbi:hypothetical protein Kpol_1039p39 [Vanderwaltozyma polyspora DSM 70294]|uniref:Uncharacterized protein n=1 Tax=Vanderwaltozyma polyspora (strain ATCC 22028 / DSM 70294 / BCRC 21397 / CBS 2163 / NBRC 10782 / NRRL Y-8283 / UCD 57-17) TaxID=436907 RepID=A7THG5_VANPO|nr:uncharacterized protein Kpol_1039p39 [Vanderwaltozyma polyspora DSM 70294]EDO18289.1 hypothetical protein Kpol_1039p39 [Vanderwaltozyma polyspora DSM 70294]